jgi:two-component system chemotaxis sensor kinase CheA
VLKQTDVAKAALEAADKAVSTAITTLDGMLEASDTQFNTLQSDVFSRLDLGFKTSIGMLIVLILLAAQNFNSMRLAIRKKMIDLAKTQQGGQQPGGSTKSECCARRSSAVYERENWGSIRGLYFLTDETRKLKLKACFPPKAIKEGQEAAKICNGAGRSWQGGRNQASGLCTQYRQRKEFRAEKRAMHRRRCLCVPLVDKDMLVGVIKPVWRSEECGVLRIATTSLSRRSQARW